MNLRRFLLLSIAMAIATTAFPQTEDPCPGFRNPTTFNTNSSLYFWSARIGERIYPENNFDTTRGNYIMSTCTDAPPIVGNNHITLSSYYSGNDNGGGISCCNDGNKFDANDHRFQIITSANAGIDEFTINGEGTGMPRIPPGYTTSIRLGDPRASGSAVHTHNWSASHTNRGSEALFYTMKVTSQNALLFINYAVVGRCYPHSAKEAGEFLIRVVKQNTDGSWPNQPINDSLWFKVSAPDIPTSGPIPPWIQGRPGSSCGSTTCSYVYKPWTKVAISLADYIYSNVRIEIYTSDCIYNVDPIYAYIAGDYQSMSLTSSGCPDPTLNVVTELKAPSSMLSYQWFVSKGNAEINIYDTSVTNNMNFRQVWPLQPGATSEDSIYLPRLNDFILEEGPNAGDTVSEKTYMCIMTSALDPNKPFSSRLYTNVVNRRPILRYRYERFCDRHVEFFNDSRTLVPEGIDLDSTYWVIYSDPATDTVIDTIRGNTASYTFPSDGPYWVKLYCVTAVEPCGASITFRVDVIGPPPANFQLSDSVICDGQQVTATCTEGCDLEHYWTFNSERQTSSLNQPSIQLTPQLGSHTLSLTTISNEGCESTVSHPINVYGIPTLSLDSRYNAICPGDSVAITGTGNVRYQWVSVPNDPDLAPQQGNSRIIVLPSTSTTYTLRQMDDNPCSHESVSVQVDVIPYPIPTIRIAPEFVSFEKNTITLDDLSPNRALTTWLFSDGLSDQGSHITHTFGNLESDSVGFSMHVCNKIDCCADTSVSIPVQLFNLWFPNAFTPNLSSNNRFGPILTMPIENFEIHIYNRLGLLVYTSTDPALLWDGTDLEGRPLPTGAYVYFYRYLRPDHDGYYEGRGTVSLIR